MSQYASRYVSNNGPGDQRPTAMEIVQDENLIGKPSDKVFFLTGISSGIGIETVRVLHATTATVYGSVCNLRKGRKAVDEVIAASPSTKAKVELVEINLISTLSIRSGKVQRSS
ncbi:hypothetical protein LTR84_000237 [Exophiala bonariae]|uniref:Uncharacterized protein n=1 Tax=Exophiala bonariae TaxID=1690606 RepID=A0AAV9NQ08_9EURO|nr:hypothetical protein LTR84_000237 [Exophiala bonariae]